PPKPIQASPAFCALVTAPPSVTVMRPVPAPPTSRPSVVVKVALSTDSRPYPPGLRPSDVEPVLLTPAPFSTNNRPVPKSPSTSAPVFVQPDPVPSTLMPA